MTDILLEESAVRVQGTLVCEGGDMTAIGKVSVDGNVTTLASLVVDELVRKSITSRPGAARSPDRCDRQSPRCFTMESTAIEG